MCSDGCEHIPRLLVPGNIQSKGCEVAIFNQVGQEKKKEPDPTLGHVDILLPLGRNVICHKVRMSLFLAQLVQSLHCTKTCKVTETGKMVQSLRNVISESRQHATDNSPYFLKNASETEISEGVTQNFNHFEPDTVHGH